MKNLKLEDIFMKELLRIVMEKRLKHSEELKNQIRLSLIRRRRTTNEKIYT